MELPHRTVRTILRLVALIPLAVSVLYIPPFLIACGATIASGEGIVGLGVAGPLGIIALLLYALGTALWHGSDWLARKVVADPEPRRQPSPELQKWRDAEKQLERGGLKGEQP